MNKPLIVSGRKIDVDTLVQQYKLIGSIEGIANADQPNLDAASPVITCEGGTLYHTGAGSGCSHLATFTSEANAPLSGFCGVVKMNAGTAADTSGTAGATVDAFHRFGRGGSVMIVDALLELPQVTYLSAGTAVYTIALYGYSNGTSCGFLQTFGSTGVWNWTVSKNGTSGFIDSGLLPVPKEEVRLTAIWDSTNLRFHGIINGTYIGGVDCTSLSGEVISPALEIGTNTGTANTRFMHLDYLRAYHGRKSVTGTVPVYSVLSDPTTTRADHYDS